jgi:hypothetical protein
MPFNQQPSTGAGELRRQVRLAHLLQFRKERPRLRQRPQDAFKLFAKVDDRNRSGLVAQKTPIGDQCAR